jgi:hypothetical protein
MRFLPNRKACLGMLGFSLLLGQMPLVAHAEHDTSDFQTWQLGTIQGHITKRILGYLDTQNNVINLTDKQGNSAQGTHEGQLLVRPALGFQVTKGWSVWQGYGWTPNFQPQFRNENQIWEQALYQHRFKHFAISNRTRLEIRWIANTDGQTAVRLRNQFRVVVPLGKTRWSLVAFDEPFINLNTVPMGPRQGFNQNWAFLGIERTLHTGVNLDVGYLNNYVRNFRPVPDRVNNVIFVSLNINLPGTGFDLHHQPPGNGKTPNKVSMSADGQAAVPLLPDIQPNLEIAPITPASQLEAQPSSGESAQSSMAEPSTQVEHVNAIPAVFQPEPKASTLTGSAKSPNAEAEVH